MPIPICKANAKKPAGKPRLRPRPLGTWLMRALELRPHSKVEGAAISCASISIDPCTDTHPSLPIMPRPSASTPHLIWAAGHFLCFFAGLRYLAGTVMFATKSGGLSRWYTATYLGAILSYCVVVYKSFGVPQLNKPYIQRALMDENVQYLFLAVYWFMSKPIFITILPFVTFSLFHVLTFVRTTVLPAVFPTPPPAPGAAQGQQGQQSKVAKMVQGWVKANYDPAMRFVAYAEVAIFARVLFGALLWRNSLMAPLFYAHFLRLRFYMSSFTRAAFQHVGAVLDGYTQHQSCPPGVRKVYLTVTDLVARYASSVLSVQNNQAQPQQQPQAAQQQPAARR